MKDLVYIFTFTSTDKEKADFVISCNADKFTLAFNQMQQVIKYYTFHDIPFNVNIDCHKPIIFNKVKK